MATHFAAGRNRTRRWNGNRYFLRGSRRRQLHVFRNGNQTRHRLRNWSLVRPIGRRRQRRRRRRGILPLIHLFGVRQFGRCPLTTATQAPLVRFDLSPEDGQLDLLVVNLEDGCQYSTLSVKDCKRQPWHCHELAFFTFFSPYFSQHLQTLSFRFYLIILTTLVLTHFACSLSPQIKQENTCIEPMT